MATVQFLDAARPSGQRIDYNAHKGMVARTVQAWRRWVTARRAAGAGRYLMEMDDHMLKDIGVSRAQATFMASHPDVGVRWHCSD